MNPHPALAALPASAREALLQATAAALSAAPFAATVSVNGADLPRADARALERDLLNLRKATRKAA